MCRKCDLERIPWQAVLEIAFVIQIVQGLQIQLE